MEKFLRQNWFKFGILILIIVISIVFYNRYTTYLDNLRSQDSQANCSKAASSWYKQTGNDSTGIGSGYENHYNSKLSKCFAALSNSMNSGKDYMVSFFVYDVYENRLLLERHTWLNQTLQDQYIKDDAFGAGSKISKTEFDQLFKIYMED